MSFKIEKRDAIGLLHHDNGPALVNAENNVVEWYWHGLLIKSTGKDAFDIKELQNGFNEHHGVLYYVLNGKLSYYINGRCAFDESGNCWTITREGTMESCYFNNIWFSWNGDKPERVGSENDSYINHYNKQVYDLYFSSLDKSAILKSDDCMNYKHYDKFGRLHNLYGPAIINSDDSREWWEHGLWIKSRFNSKMIESTPKKVDHDTWIHQARDNSKRLYNKNLDLVDSGANLPTVVFINGDEQYYKAGNLVREKIAGKYYDVFAGEHFASKDTLVNTSVCNKEFGTNFSQKELEDKFREFMKTKMSDRSRLEYISGRFMQEDETVVWRDVHEELLTIFGKSYDHVADFAALLGFRKVITFINYWFWMRESNLKEKYACRILDLYSKMTKELAKKVANADVSFEKFTKLLPGADLHYLLEILLMKSDNWHLIMYICEVGNISFDYLVDCFNSSLNEDRSAKFVFNYILSQFDSCNVGKQQRIRYLLQDMIFMK